MSVMTTRLGTRAGISPRCPSVGKVPTLSLDLRFCEHQTGPVAPVSLTGCNFTFQSLFSVFSWCLFSSGGLPDKLQLSLWFWILQTTISIPSRLPINPDRSELAAFQNKILALSGLIQDSAGMKLGSNQSSPPQGSSPFTVRPRHVCFRPLTGNEAVILFPQNALWFTSLLFCRVSTPVDNWGNVL